MEEREAINNRAGRKRRLFCVEAMFRLGEVGGFCLYCRPHKNSKSRSARALVIWHQASILATCEFRGPLPRNFRIVIGSLEHSDLTLAATHGIRSTGRSYSRSNRLMSRCCQDTLNAARR